MRSGKSILSDIVTRVDAARSNLRQADQRVRAARDEFEAIRTQEARALARLAEVRLGVLAGGTVSRRIDDADRAALAQIDERGRERQRLDRAVDAGATELAELRRRRDELARARDERGEAHRSQVAATRQRLTETEAYRARQGHLEHALGQARNAAEKAARAERDREVKRQPYENDKLFHYLWQRRYRFDEYRAYPLFATLDAWVADLCDYGKAHRDYGMLLAIPDRLRAHADELAARADEQQARLTAFEDAALAEDGAPALAEALQTAQRALDEAEAELRDAEERHDRVCLEQQALVAGNDPYSVRAAALIEDQLGAEDIATLRQDALATATGADDELVRAVAELRHRAEQVRPQLEVAERQHGTSLQALRDLEAVERDFRRQDFDASNSVFDDDFDLGWLVGNLLRGSMRRTNVFRHMRRHQSWQSSSSGSFFGGFGSSGGGGFGGFGGGGSFGGGGFSSGGSFGGGGGFSTGGGF